MNAEKGGASPARSQFASWTRKKEYGLELERLYQRLLKDAIDQCCVIAGVTTKLAKVSGASLQI
jgi:hypothetical protein